MKSLYTAHLHVTGGRIGHARSDDGLLDVALAMPRAIGGTGDATNPEQLFGAGYAGCFASSVAFAAKSMGLDAGTVTVDADVTLGVGDDGAYGLLVALRVAMPGVAVDQRETVLAEAKRICAYSNATRGGAETTVTLVD